MKHALSFTGKVVCLGLLLGASAGAAQEAAPIAQGAATSSVPEAEFAPRLLFLANGGVLRARARPTGTGWEIQSGKETRILGEASVLRTVLERDALADAKRLEQQLSAGPRQDQDLRRVGLAEWLSKQGLMAEALAQLDRVLSADPDQRQALRLMASLAPQVGLGKIDAAMASDEPVIGVLRAAANGTATVREIAIQRLASRGASDELRTALRAQLTSHSPRLRALATLALRRIYPGKSLKLDDVKELMRRSVLDGSEVVRAEAARALRDTQDPEVATAAMKALNSSNPALRENSIQALGTMGYPAAVEPLMTYLGRLNTAMQSGSKSSGVGGGSIFIGKQTAYVQDFDVEVAQFQAVADPQVNVLIEGSVLDARVHGSFTVSFATEARLVRDSLSSLTGQDLGSSNREWLAWWNENKSDWTGPPKAASTTTTK